MAIKASGTITLSCVVDVFATTRYYLLQSSTLNRPQKPTTNPPGGSWDDAEPGYTAGSTDTLYFVDLTIFSDGTWAYSMVSVSSAYEAAKAAWNKAQGAETAAQAAQDTVDALKIGGRNLLLDSARERTVTVPAGGTDASSDRIFLSEYGTTQITEGAELTASFDYEVDLETTTRGAIYTRLNSFSTTPARVVSDVIAAPRGRASITFKVTAAQAQYTSAFMLRVRITVANEGASFRAWNFKLELGNRATDWTPAPEDVEAATAEAQAAADAAQAAADGAQVSADAAQVAADAARAEFRRVVRIDEAGLHVGDNQSNGEVLVDSNSVNVVINGVGYSRFAANYVQFGETRMQRSADGGLVFKRA